METRIIGLTGKMRVGKTTATEYILKTYPNFVKVNFKDALIEEIKQNFMPMLEQMMATYSIRANNPEINTIDDLFIVKPPLVRSLLQCYGTEVRRGDDSDYWVKQWKKKVNLVTASGRDVVCDDVRFLNEADTVKEAFGTVVRLTRPDVVDTTSHSSEMEMDQIKPDITIDVQQGDFNSLFADLDKICK